MIVSQYQMKKKKKEKKQHLFESFLIPEGLILFDLLIKQLCHPVKVISSIHFHFNRSMCVHIFIWHTKDVSTQRYAWLTVFLQLTERYDQETRAAESLLCCSLYFTPPPQNKIHRSFIKPVYKQLFYETVFFL